MAHLSPCLVAPEISAMLYPRVLSLILSTLLVEGEHLLGDILNVQSSSLSRLKCGCLSHSTFSLCIIIPSATTTPKPTNLRILLAT
jgi:hypothetical protein